MSISSKKGFPLFCSQLSLLLTYTIAFIFYPTFSFYTSHPSQNSLQLCSFFWHLVFSTQHFQSYSSRKWECRCYNIGIYLQKKKAKVGTRLGVLFTLSFDLKLFCSGRKCRIFLSVMVSSRSKIFNTTNFGSNSWNCKYICLTNICQWISFCALFSLLFWVLQQTCYRVLL